MVPEQFHEDARATAQRSKHLAYRDVGRWIECARVRAFACVVGRTDAGAGAGAGAGRGAGAGAGARLAFTCSRTAGVLSIWFPI